MTRRMRRARSTRRGNSSWRRSCCVRFPRAPCSLGRGREVASVSGGGGGNTTYMGSGVWASGAGVERLLMDRGILGVLGG